MKKRDSPIVYICSKYSGDVGHNTMMARRFCRLAVEQGFIPLAPHLFLPQFISEEKERDVALDMDLRFLEVCQELWICGDEISSGMQTEIDEARRAGMTVRRISEEELYVRDR